MATRISTGDQVDYTPGSAVTAGDVVVFGDLIFVADVDIPANTLGALSSKGVFSFPKAITAGSGLVFGKKYYWDATNSLATNVSTNNKLIGYSVATTIDADTKVSVRLGA